MTSQDEPDCGCEFDYPEPGGDESWHYWRTCGGCGFQWGALHCPHDGAQNPCPVCGWMTPGAIRPMDLAFPAPPMTERANR